MKRINFLLPTDAKWLSCNVNVLSTYQIGRVVLLLLQFRVFARVMRLMRWLYIWHYLKWLHDKNNSSTEWINESWSENWRFFKWIFLNLSQYNFSMLSNCMRVQRHYHWIPTMTYLRSQPLPNNEKVDSMEMASITLNGCSSNTRIET